MSDHAAYPPYGGGPSYPVPPYQQPYYQPVQYYGLQPTLEQGVRRDVVLKLLDKGTPSTRLERTADAIVEYVMNGKKTDLNLVKKIEVALPGDERAEANAYLFDNNTIQIELKDPERLAALFENLDIYGVSFYGIPSRPVETPKDN